MNRLRIKSRIWNSAPEKFEEDMILTEVFADGKLLIDFESNYLATDLLSLERSIHQDGEPVSGALTLGTVIPLYAVPQK